MLPKFTPKQTAELKGRLGQGIVIMSGPTNDGMSSNMANTIRENREHYARMGTNSARPSLALQPANPGTATGLIAGLLRRIGSCQ